MKLPTRPTVLCVEERIHDLDELTTSLADAGHDVVRTKSAGEAMRFLRSQRVDGVLIDSTLRGVDALEVRNEIANLCGNLPVMLIHGTGQVLQAQIRVLGAWIEHTKALPRSM